MKSIDAVKMMRSIRDKLSKKYSGKPEILMKDLNEIREKYSLKENEIKKIKINSNKKFSKRYPDSVSC